MPAVFEYQFHTMLCCRLSFSLLEPGSIIVSNNSVASVAGGGIYAADSSIRICGFSTFKHNHANLFGGGINVQRCSLVSSGNFLLESNQAEENGGGISMQESTLSMNGNVKFSANIAGLSGGAIYAALDCSAVFDGSRAFSRNSATYGGATIAVDEGKLTRSGYSENSGISGGVYLCMGISLS